MVFLMRSASKRFITSWYLSPTIETHSRYDEVKYLVHSHIKSFKARQSQYLFNKYKNVRYLPETLSVKKNA